MTKVVKLSALIFISLLISLVILEVGLRLFNIKPPIFQLTQSMVKTSDNPVLGYELNPDHPEINSYGLKGPELITTKPDTVYRLVTLGDSVTYGCCGTPSLNGYPEMLSQALLPPSTHSELEVINAGIVGYNTIQEAEFFSKKIKPLSPDFLIIQVTLNDFEPKTFEYDDLIGTLEPSKQTPARKFYDVLESTKNHLGKSVVFQELAYYYLLQRSSTSDPNQAKPAQHKWQDYTTIADGLAKLQQQLPDNLKERTLIVLFPYFVPDLNAYPPDLLQEHEAIKNTATTLGFQFMDLLPCYQTEYNLRHESFQQTKEDVAHPNAYGHSVAAQCIAAELVAKHQFSLNSLYSFSAF